MTDELKKDWRTEMEEQEAKRKEQEAEYERSLKSRHRLDIVLNCLWALTIAFWTVSIYMGVVHLGRRLDECIEGRQTNTEVPTEVQTSTTVPLVVPDDIYKGYAMVAGVEVPRITRDSGLTPPPF